MTSISFNRSFNKSKRFRCHLTKSKQKVQDFVNWIKADSAACSVIGLNKRKYLGNSLVRLLIPCPIDLIGH